MKILAFQGLAFQLKLEHELCDETIRSRAERRTLRLTRFARTVRGLVKDDRRLALIWDRAIEAMPDHYSAEDLMAALKKLEDELVRRRDVCQSLRNTLLPMLKRGLSGHQSS